MDLVWASAGGWSGLGFEGGPNGWRPSCCLNLAPPTWLPMLFPIWTTGARHTVVTRDIFELGYRLENPAEDAAVEEIVLMDPLQIDAGSGKPTS